MWDVGGELNSINPEHLQWHDGHVDSIEHVLDPCGTSRSIVFMHEGDRMTATLSGCLNELLWSDGDIWNRSHYDVNFSRTYIDEWVLEGGEICVVTEGDSLIWSDGMVEAIQYVEHGMQLPNDGPTGKVSSCGEQLLWTDGDVWERRNDPISADALGDQAYPPSPATPPPLPASNANASFSQEYQQNQSKGNKRQTGKKDRGSSSSLTLALLLAGSGLLAVVWFMVRRPASLPSESSRDEWQGEDSTDSSFNRSQGSSSNQVWYRSWSQEHNRYFYYTEAGESSWEEPKDGWQEGEDSR